MTMKFVASVLLLLTFSESFPRTTGTERNAFHILALAVDTISPCSTVPNNSITEQEFSSRLLGAGATPVQGVPKFREKYRYGSPIILKIP